MEQQIIVDLSISADELLRYYRGHARLVSCRARDGRRVQFPADLLRPFVERNGVQGSFRIRYSAEGKFRQIEKIAVER